MKRAFIAFLIISFIAIAVFGFVSIGHTDGNVGCIAETSQGVCPMEGSSLGTAFFHLNSFKSFSTALITTDSLISLITIALSALIYALFALSHTSESPILARVSYKIADKGPIISASKSRILSFLSLFENSPANL